MIARTLNCRADLTFSRSGFGVTPFMEKRADRLMQGGFDAVACGDIRRARDEFRHAAKLNESADSLTYWAWMEFHLGHTMYAIKLCQKAIRLDPDNGNPYNDIGSYLVSQGKLDEAIPWFEDALDAKRYGPRHFPHLNLAKIYVHKKDYTKALEEYEKALEYDPESSEILMAISTLKKTIR